MAIRSYDVLAVGAIAGGVLFSHAIVSSLTAQRDSTSRVHRVEWIETAPQVERTIVIQPLKHIRPSVVVVPRTGSVVRFLPLPDAPTVSITAPTIELLETLELEKLDGELFEIPDDLKLYEIELEGDGAVLLHDESGRKRVKVIVKKRKKSGEGGNR